MEHFEYEALADKTLRITRYMGNAQNLIVPDEIEGQAVTEIAGGTFAAAMRLSAVAIPRSIRRIGEGAFRESQIVVIFAHADTPAERYAQENGMIHAVLHSENEKTIQAMMGRIPVVYVSGIYQYTLNETNEAVIGCYKGPRGGERLDVPAELDGYRVAEIGKRAFENSAFECYVLPEGLRRIGERAFDMCFWMESITLPQGLEVIDERAFSRCERLRMVSLPESVREVGNGAFGGCEELRQVYIPGMQTALGYEIFACT